MSSFTVKEAAKFFRQSYEIKCDEKDIQEWMDDPYTKCTGSELNEDHVWEFSYWGERKGTAYEEGIDDQTKINRLLEEITRLEEKVSSLEKENTDLEMKLEIMPF